MSISMHLDEYMARRGIVPDDTIVNDDPCAVFDGSVIEDPRMDEARDNGEPAPAGTRSVNSPPSPDGFSALDGARFLEEGEASAELRRAGLERAELERAELERAEETVRDLLG